MGKDIFSKKSRFSIRKLNIGVCSVLLGTLIMIGHTAQADETTSDGATVAATAVSASQGEGVAATTSPTTAPESVPTTTVTPAATETVAATSAAPTTSVASSAAVSSEAPASTSVASSAPVNSVATSTSPVVASEVTGSTNVSTAKPATASEASRSVTLLQHHQLQQAQRVLSQIILVRQKLQMRLVYVVVEVSQQELHQRLVQQKVHKVLTIQIKKMSKVMLRLTTK